MQLQSKNTTYTTEGHATREHTTLEHATLEHTTLEHTIPEHMHNYRALNLRACIIQFKTIKVMARTLKFKTNYKFRLRNNFNN
jgi:hypothetical protein